MGPSFQTFLTNDMFEISWQTTPSEIGLKVETEKWQYDSTFQSPHRTEL